MYIQEGNSALMVAVRNDETGVVEELVKAGAKLNLQNTVYTCLYKIHVLHIQHIHVQSMCP